MSDEEAQIALGRINALNNRDRWRLHNYWCSELNRKISRNIADLCRDYERCASTLKELEDGSHVNILKSVMIIYFLS